MKVYTKKGDTGTTSLIKTKNIPKSDDRIQLVGNIDELTSQIGMIKSRVCHPQVYGMLETIQNNLITVMAGVADPYNFKYRLKEEEVTKVEQEIDRMEGLFVRKPGFVLPGANPLSAQMDVTRTVARRCERWLSLVAIRYGADGMTKKYLNRLADYFYILARYTDVLAEEGRLDEIEKSNARELTETGMQRPGAGTARGQSEAGMRKPEKIDARELAETGMQKTEEQNAREPWKTGAWESTKSEGADTKAEAAAGKPQGGTPGGKGEAVMEQVSEVVIQEVLKRLSQNGRITLAQAKRLIDRVEAYAESQGLKAVIAVCNPEGNPVAVHVMDGAFLVSFDVAVKKAYTSASVKMSTMELSKLIQPGETFQGLDKLQGDKMVFFGGGVPLKVGEQLIGALGVSGGTGEEDNAIAEYALKVLPEVLA
ncbi:MAG: cob(I)yrinic acid a,c-diamide adenosyltransferase [Eubacteriales bacterium]|nr:cob(I)yrinic acid a,c-diamide adenosyltransferase [Eubacteriales bacterium]